MPLGHPANVVLGTGRIVTQREIRKMYTPIMLFALNLDYPLT